MPATTSRARAVYLRWSVWFVYSILFAIAIPWYWSDEKQSIIFGVPIWAAVSILASALVSIFTAWLLIKHWPSDDEIDSREN